MYTNLVHTDWIASLFRRVFALYENLPEEGGKKNTTGGKQEESVLKTIKNTLDVVCLHLSDQHFDLVLKLVHDYVTTNAKSNAVRVIGQLIACLARAKPQKTLDKFLPFCVDRIKDELRHGASSVRTTSTHAAVPSDTTLHWSEFYGTSSNPTLVYGFRRSIYIARLFGLWWTSGKQIFLWSYQKSFIDLIYIRY